MAHPFEGWSMLNEGWDGGAIAVEELVQNVKTVVTNSIKTILAALVVLWGAKFLVTLLTILSTGLGYWVTPAFGTVAMISGYLGIFVGVVVAIAQQSLYRPIQLQAFEGREFVGGAMEALKLARDVLGKVALTMLLVFASTTLGLIVCGFGAFFAFFFFCQAPYLAATTELKPWECMRRSYELNKAYAVPAGISVAVSLVGVGVLNGCGGALVGGVGTALMSVSPPIGSAVMGIGADVLGFVSGALVLVVTGAIFTTIQSVERGVAFRR